MPFGQLTTTMMKVVLVTWLLASQAFVASGYSAADYPKVLKLQRQNKLSGGKVVELPVNGTGQYMFHGPYLTRLELGNPPQSLDVLIDTGSSVPWVACQTSSGPGTRGLFNPALSSPTLLPCSDQSCQSMADFNLAKCNASRCVYDLNYGNGDSTTSSSATGNYLSDAVHLDGLSTPPHIVFGKYYTLNLESISINGETLPIDSSVFRQSSEQFTFVDSGTTLAYLADGADDPFVSAIRAAIPPSASPFIGSNGQLCFVTFTSIDFSFPSVELHFAGGVKMMLKPHNYLHYVKQSIYCIAWLRNTGRQITILGDIVLVDKLIVHDMENMRLGWMDFDCSRPVNITTSPGKKRVANSGQALRIISTPIAVALILICYIILHA